MNLALRRSSYGFVGARLQREVAVSERNLNRLKFWSRHPLVHVIVSGGKHTVVVATKIVVVLAIFWLIGSLILSAQVASGHAVSGYMPFWHWPLRLISYLSGHG
jgi:hypothetical protein